MKQLSPFLANNPEMFEQGAQRNLRINEKSSGHFWNDRLITKSPNYNFKAALHKYPTVTLSLHERALDSSNRKASRCWAVTGPTRRCQTLRPVMKSVGSVRHVHTSVLLEVILLWLCSACSSLHQGALTGPTDGLVLCRSPGTSSFCFQQWICFGGARL